jgi:hypothetical protein
MTRFYLYGILLGLSILLQGMVDKFAGVQFLVSGLIIAAIGVYVLTNFIKKKP